MPNSIFAHTFANITIVFCCEILPSVYRNNHLCL